MAKPLNPIALAFLVIVAFCMAASLSGCIASFSELQSAQLVGPGHCEVTPSCSSLWWLGDDSEHTDNRFGVQVATGVADNTDLRLRLEHASGDGYSFTMVGVGPKVGIIRDRFAFYGPIGMDTADGDDSLEFHPTLLFTSVYRGIEINASGKTLIPLHDAELWDALNLGLGKTYNRWVVRPEAGIAFNGRGDGYFHFSVGLTYYSNR